MENIKIYQEFGLGRHKFGNQTWYWNETPWEIP
jgi:hypothetical protein